MRHVERAVAVAFAVGMMLQLPDAVAQSAGAEALFRDGRILIKQGKLDAGCDKLEQSEKLESSVGTLLNLGNCREKQGRAATAWAAFRKAEAMAMRDGKDTRRMLEARKRAQRLEDDLATITVQAGPNAKASGLVIKRDGEELDPAVWGTGIVVDPGAHTIVAESPGKKPWQTEVSVGRAGKRWVVVPSLEPLPEVTKRPTGGFTTPPPQTVVVTQPATEPAIYTTPTTVTRTWSTTRGLAIGLAVAGAGVLGGGIYYGNRSRSLEDRSNAICPVIECSDARGLRLNDDAQSAATRANIFFVTGGVAVAAATVMWFVGRPDAETVVTPSVGADHIGAALTGRF